MAVGHRMRRDIKLANKHMRREAYRWGQQVNWYEFNRSSVSDDTDLDLYDEGGIQSRPGTTDQGTSRMWKAPKPVQVQMARLDEGAEQYTEEGAYEVDRLTLVVSRQALQNSGIDPEDDRSDDRIGFAGRVFAVNHFDKRGRLADTYLTITVTCTQEMDDERQTDDNPWHA